MNAFEGLDATKAFDATPDMVRRLRKRHALVVEPFRAELRGARVLDLGAHDGRR